MQTPNVIERAFQLAAESGSVDEVRRKLMSEGYFAVEGHLGGPQIRREITQRLNPKLIAKPKSGGV